MRSTVENRLYTPKIILISNIDVITVCWQLCLSEILVILSCKVRLGKVVPVLNN
jgi:hypothetical protein